MSNQCIEQIEIIERTVEEGRRPIPPEEAINYQPSTHIRTSTERFVTEGQLDTSQDPLERRFLHTGERDFSKDSSFLYQSGQIPLPPPPLQQSTPEKSSSQLGINNYGYDLHEIITDEGGARVVETRGAGQALSPGLFSDSSILAPQQNDRSLLDTTMLGAHGRSPPRLVQHESSVRKLDYSSVTTTRGTPLTTRLKIAEQPVWSQHLPATQASDSSLTRKASYKKMQESQAEPEPYAPSSNATIVTKASSPTVAQHKWSGGKAKRGVGNFMNSLMSQAHGVFDQLRHGKFTPRSIVALLLLLLLFFFILFVLWQIFSALFFWDSVYTFLLYPPVCEECLKRNPSAAVNGHRTPSKLSAHQSSSSQAHFELIGRPPFRSDSYTVVDFSTGFVAIADHAFVDESGRHTTCFIMQLDTNALPDMRTVMYAIRHSPHDVYTQFGWHEYWQFNPEPVDPSYVHGKFREEVPHCRAASHWYFLRPTVYTRDSGCSGCYDFCLPDYAVQRRQKYDDEASIGIRRLNCFRLYVPEWSEFSVQSDSSGGHWQYPRVQSRYTQRDVSPVGSAPVIVEIAIPNQPART